MFYDIIKVNISFQNHLYNLILIERKFICSIESFNEAHNEKYRKHVPSKIHKYARNDFFVSGGFEFFLCLVAWVSMDTELTPCDGRLDTDATYSTFTSTSYSPTAVTRRYELWLHARLRWRFMNQKIE